MTCCASDANKDSYCITIAAALALHIVLSRENKKREDYIVNEEERDRLAFMDLTDKEVSNANTTYTLQKRADR